MKSSKTKLLGWAMFVVFSYLIGPTPPLPVYKASLPPIPISGPNLEKYISAKEQTHRLKANNQARIVWADTANRTKTPYAFVYLHGFGACQEEANPAHRLIAARFHSNLYLARLSEHGIDTTDQLIQLTPEQYWESAKEALAIGKQLGERVIIIGTSTGGSQALQLAAAFPKEVAGLILFSPNIAINNNKAWLLTMPWGLQIARMITGGLYVNTNDSEAVFHQYWNTHFRLEAAIALQQMLHTTMIPDVFKQVHQPVLSLYFYKDEAHQDPVVRVDAIKKMMKTIATPTALKREQAIPNAESHVIGCGLQSKDVNGVVEASISFLREIMKLK